MSRTALIITAALVGFLTIDAGAQSSTSEQAAVEAYLIAIRSAESQTSPGGIEAAFSAFTAMREALLRRDDQQNALESLSEEEFISLRGELPGALVNRQEVVYVEPDVAYFGRLAAAAGDAADRAFFTALRMTYPTSVWPTYIQQQTDYSGCTRFGSMSLVEAYRTWAEFQRRFPDRYVAAASTETDAVLSQLSESTCACRTTAEVGQELREFIRRFPASPIQTEVDQRIQALRDGESDIRPNCRSG